ncbi:hypothetical protein SLEP1_g36352 [Rubroshorea leprosula]|uniref:Ycf15 n=1 Tax=Rubroshorea leprosula TaxID=152421 RepID=A0AAV5KRF6_9ROSI|nr:hypothetical protein SLEP1_g36352 [Rubroshorea leprosula]
MDYNVMQCSKHIIFADLGLRKDKKKPHVGADEEDCLFSRSCRRQNFL